MEYRAAKLKLPAKLKGVDEVAVVSQSHIALDVIDNNGLGVDSALGARRAVSDMAYRNVALTETV